MVDFFKLGSYLATVDEDLWVWDENAETVQWSTGMTIGFREEFAAIVERLHGDGLPPFGAIVLFVAACRNEPSGWDDDAPFGDSEPLNAEMTALANHFERIKLQRHFHGLLDPFARIHGLPEACRATLKAKVALAEEVFRETKQRSNPRPSDDFVQAVRRRHFSPVTARRAIAALEEGLAEFDAESWPTRFRTGIDDAPAPAEDIELPECAPANAETVRRLIDELRHDRELSSVASVARDLLAVAYLPRPMGSREELPIGGVSDISNRGSLHQLLIAELANDDFTLAMRISQGEALYLRREDPPTPPPGDRALVIDAGLRMWGVPRVFATSVGLALAATTARNGEWKAFRIEGNEHFPVDLGSRAGVLEHLERLSPALSPMEAFQTIYREAALASVREVVLVTAEETAVDPEIVAELPTERGPALFVASVSRDGEFKLREPRRRGSEPLAVARLDVGSLATVNRAPLQARTDPRLPPIFSTRPFPLLVPCQPKTPHAILHPTGGVVGLTGDGRLMHWPKRDCGAIELASSTGRGDVRCLAALPDGTITVVRILSAESPVTMTTALPAGDIVNADLGVYAGSTTTVFVRGRMLYLAIKQMLLAFDPTTGDVVGKRALEGTTTVSKFGFVREGGRWRYPSVEHGKLALLEVGTDHNLSLDHCVDLFRMPKSEDVFGLTPGWFVISVLDPGTVFKPTGNEPSVGGPARSLKSISSAGRYIALEAQRGRYLMDLQNGKAWDLKSYSMPNELPSPYALSYRTRISGVYFVDDGGLRLAVPSGHIGLTSTRGEMYWMHLPAPDSKGTLFSGIVERVRGEGLTFRRARLTATREAVLDKRGLLHLFDSSGLLPDVTITLFTENANAAWSSRLGSVGNPYCFGDRIPHPNDWTPFLDAIAQYGKDV